MYKSKFSKFLLIMINDKGKDKFFIFCSFVGMPEIYIIYPEST